MIPGWLDLALSLAVLCTLPMNWHWSFWTNRLRRAVPGSLQQEHAKAQCRRTRHPGFLFWPLIICDNALTAANPSEGLSLRIFCAFFALLFVQLMRREWLEYRRQIEEDEDDWWNRAKRLGKRLRRAAREAATVRVPQAAPASF